MTSLAPLSPRSLIASPPVAPGIAALSMPVGTTPAFPVALGLLLQQPTPRQSTGAAEPPAVAADLAPAAGKLAGPTDLRQQVAARGEDLPDDGSDQGGADPDPKDGAAVAAPLTVLGLTPTDPDPSRALVAVLAMPAVLTATPAVGPEPDAGPPTASVVATRLPAMTPAGQPRSADRAILPPIGAATDPMAPTPLSTIGTPPPAGSAPSSSVPAASTGTPPVSPPTDPALSTDQRPALSEMSVTESAPTAKSFPAVADQRIFDPAGARDDSSFARIATNSPAIEAATRPIAPVVGAAPTLPARPATPGQPATRHEAAPLPAATTRGENGAVVGAVTPPADPVRPARFTGDQTLAVAIAAPPPIAAAASADQPALDLGDRRWPAAMVDHIERLRDAADAADTRIRVVPDALGPIDVAVRRNGEAVDVRLTAAHEATRAILADAQPALTAIAADRGVTIGSTSVDVAAPSIVAAAPSPGGTMQDQSRGFAQSQPQPQPRQPLAPAPARPLTDLADDDASADTRLA